ncbi:putative calcium-binding protein CML25 [Acorus gramineus]|uniref:Calcium-binding protein CML25 n=1 Tax=Acorus gramineus TaxID=55184 RepID=A0AAV9BDX1_ACOGR|nr:putative calcium-binding protein CML25 [Acorus gramineus]
MADSDGDGFIDLGEFMELNTRDVDDAATLEDLREAFAVFDVNCDGSISAEELHMVLKKVTMVQDEAAPDLGVPLMEIYIDDDCLPWKSMIQRRVRSFTSHLIFSQLTGPHLRRPILLPIEEEKQEDFNAGSADVQTAMW